MEMSFTNQSSHSAHSAQSSKDHYISSFYMVLQSFTEERSRTEAWRISYIAHKGTFNQIVKKLLQATFLVENLDSRKLIITDSGRMFSKFLETMLSDE